MKTTAVGIINVSYTLLTVKQIYRVIKKDGRDLKPL